MLFGKQVYALEKRDTQSERVCASEKDATPCNTHCKANIIVKLTIGMGMLTCAARCCIECLYCR